jgi:pilus assembly protein Flp/PilA
MKGRRYSFPSRLGVALITDRRGATAVEYGLILALIVIAMVVALKGLADTTTGMWNNVAATVGSVMGH